MEFKQKLKDLLSEGARLTLIRESKKRARRTVEECDLESIQRWDSVPSLFIPHIMLDAQLPRG